MERKRGASKMGVPIPRFCVCIYEYIPYPSFEKEKKNVYCDLPIKPLFVAFRISCWPKNNHTSSLSPCYFQMNTFAAQVTCVCFFEWVTDWRDEGRISETFEWNVFTQKLFDGEMAPITAREVNNGRWSCFAHNKEKIKRRLMCRMDLEDQRGSWDILDWKKVSDRFQVSEN